MGWGGKGERGRKWRREKGVGGEALGGAVS